MTIDEVLELLKPTIGDLSDLIEAQARQIWKHLPENEVADGERVWLKHADDGALMIRSSRGATYIEGEDRTWKYQAVAKGGRKTLTEFVDGKAGLEVLIDDEWNVDDAAAHDVRRDLDRLLSEIK